MSDSDRYRIIHRGSPLPEPAPRRMTLADRHNLSNRPMLGSPTPSNIQQNTTPQRQDITLQNRNSDFQRQSSALQHQTSALQHQTSTPQHQISAPQLQISTPQHQTSAPSTQPAPIQTNMSSKEPLKILLKGIADLRECGEHADLTITCGTDTHKVHKAIMCSQSEFFRLACRKHTGSGGDFKEAQSGIVEIPCRDNTEPEDFHWDADAEDPVSFRLMIHYCYHLDYLEDQTAQVRTQRRADEDFDKIIVLKTGLLLEHAKMYALGDKYGLPGLKDLALKKYEEAYLFTSAGFANSITVAFTSTIDSDMALRNVIITILAGNMCFFMSKPKIDQIVKDLPLLSHALLRKKLSLP